MADALSIILLTRGEFDVKAALVECLSKAYSDQDRELAEGEDTDGMLKVVWSRRLKVNDGRTLYRCTFTPSTPEDGDDDVGRDLIGKFAARVRALVGEADPGMAHVVRFISPAQLHVHKRLYSEIYEIEMRLREVLTYIFIDEFPDRPYGFLDGNVVKLQGEKSQHSAEYLGAHDENQLFQILFDEYDNLNNPPVSNIQTLLQAIREQASYEAVRSAVTDAPIKKQPHQDFLALLKAVIPDIEAVRNAVAHNRDLPNSAEQKYREARDKLNKGLADFWNNETEPVAQPAANNNAPPESVEQLPLPPPPSVANLE